MWCSLQLHVRSCQHSCNRAPQVRSGGPNPLSVWRIFGMKKIRFEGPRPWLLPRDEHGRHQPTLKVLSMLSLLRCSLRQPFLPLACVEEEEAAPHSSVASFHKVTPLPQAFERFRALAQNLRRGLWEPGVARQLLPLASLICDAVPGFPLLLEGLAAERPWFQRLKSLGFPWGLVVTVMPET